MATRSFISIKHPDKTFTGVYCHWDGYPEFNGKILKEDYQDRQKVIELIDGGFISSLKTRNTWETGAYIRDENGDYVYDEQGFMISDNDREPQPLYYHERGDADVDPKHFKKFSQLKKSAQEFCCEYLYVYDETTDEKWICKKI